MDLETIIQNLRMLALDNENTISDYEKALQVLRQENTELVEENRALKVALQHLKAELRSLGYEVE